MEIQKVFINDHHKMPTYLSGRLSLPSKNAPEDIVKNYVNKSSEDTNSCKIEKKFVNEQGETVVKAQQMYKGIKIRGASQSYIIGKDGVIETISGLNIPKVKNLIKGDIKLSENDAKEAVKKDLSTIEKKVDEYDPELNQWRTISEAPSYRDGAGITVYDNKVYIVGGRNQNRNFVSTMDVYDTINNSWTTGVPGQSATDLVLTGISVNGVPKLYSFFGSNNSGKLNKIMAFDFTKKSGRLLEQAR